MLKATSTLVRNPFLVNGLNLFFLRILLCNASLHGSGRISLYRFCNLIYFSNTISISFKRKSAVLSSATTWLDNLDFNYLITLINMMDFLSWLDICYHISLWKEIHLNKTIYGTNRKGKLLKFFNKELWSCVMADLNLRMLSIRQKKL